jgi:predicted N-acetyltransferase YhbS
MNALRSWDHQPRLYEQVFELLDTGFPGISQHVSKAARLGLDWRRVSTPFVVFEGATAAAHAGLLELPMVLDGREQLVAGVHAVCTRPEHRGQGHFRRVMEAALDHAAARYRSVLLIGEPGLYERFGFRWVREHVFRAPASPAKSAGRFRPLEIDSSDDVTLLDRLLAGRTAVSRLAGVVREKGVFQFNSLSRLPAYSQELDAAVSMQLDNRTLKLFDVVAAAIPSLVDITARIPEPIDQVLIHFSPDRLRAEATPEPCVFEGDSYLMVKGPFPPEGRPFMLPPTARC